MTAMSSVRFASGSASGVVAEGGVALVVDAPGSPVVEAVMAGFACGSSVEQIMTVVSAIGFDQLPAFALVVASPSGYRVIHRGAVMVCARATGVADVLLHQPRVTTWREEVFSDVDEFEISVVGEAASVEYQFNAGIVPAAKLVWTPGRNDPGALAKGQPAPANRMTTTPKTHAAANLAALPVAELASLVPQPAARDVGPPDSTPTPQPIQVSAHGRDANLLAPEGGTGDEALDVALPFDHTLFRPVKTVASVEGRPAVPATTLEMQGGSLPAGASSSDTILAHRAGADSSALIDDVPGSDARDDDSSATGIDNSDHDGYTLARPSGQKAVMPSVPGDSTNAQLLQVVVCPSGHSNPPTAHACRVCSQPIRDRMMSLVPRPSLGTLEFSTGASASLIGPLLIGRNPPTGQLVDGEPAQVVAIENSELSRFHVAVHVTEWFVHVVDQRSTNETIIRVPGKPHVTLRPYERFQIAPGTVVDLGGAVTFVYTTK